MQKSKNELPKKEIKTGMPVIDNSIFVFVFIWGKIRQDIRAFFLIVLLFFVILLGVIYLKEIKISREREDAIRLQEKSICKETTSSLEYQIKLKNERIISLEKDFSEYQRLMSDRADAILDKVIALKSSKK